MLPHQQQGLETTTTGNCDIFSRFFFSIHLPGVAEKGAVAALYPTVVVLGTQRLYNDLAIGALMAVIGAGRATAALPAALLYPKFGLVNTQWIGLVVAILGATLSVCLVQWYNIVALGAALYVMAFGTGIMSCARQPMIYYCASPEHVGRVSFMVGGGAAWAQSIGPLVAGSAMQWGSVSWSLLANVGMLLVAGLSMAIGCRQLQDVEEKVRLSDLVHGASPELCPALRFLVSRARLKLMLQLLLIAVTFGICVYSRRVMIPLVALAHGLDSIQLSGAISASYMVDSTFFWVGGWISDERGRRWSAIPAFVFFGMGFLTLSAARLGTFLAALLLLGAAEAVSCGIINTLISDVVPREAGVVCFVVLRILPDIGAPLAPALLGPLIVATSPTVACYAVAALSLVGGGPMTLLFSLFDALGSTAQQRRASFIGRILTEEASTTPLLPTAAKNSSSFFSAAAGSGDHRPAML